MNGTPAHQNTRRTKHNRDARQATRPAGRAAFTLVEMLVVLVIIAVLIASVMGALRSAQRTAWRTKARDSTRQLVGAWNLYLIHYREFPEAGTFKDPVTGGYAASINNLNLLNAEQVYIELNGLERQQGLRDKWKRPIGFTLDFDYNGEVANPAPEVYGAKAKDYEFVRATAIAWSQGATPQVKRTWIVQW